MQLIWNLWCDQTTEAGEDEIYYLVSSKTSDGRIYQTRLPSGNGHWNLNDGNEPRNINNIPILFPPIVSGQSAKVVVVIMEEDGGTSQPWTDITAAVLGAIPTGVTQVLGGILGTLGQFLTLADSDDFIGAFEVNIRNNGGILSADWNALERSVYLGHSSGPDSNGFRFNGDGSNYYGWGRLES